MMDAASSALQVSLHKQMDSGEGDAFSLDVQFSAEPGFTVLFGASGAGKTTILDSITGLQVPDDGRVSVGSRVLFDSARNVNVPTSRRRIGYLLQTLALFPHMTARQNIEYGLASIPVADRLVRIEEAAASFGITGVLNRRPAQMSGGERQRVALARALVTRPCALLLDEPLTALDAATKSKIVDDLRRWIAAHAVPVLYVTHDRQEVYALGDRVIALEAGRIVAEGPPQAVLVRPQSESVAQLAGFENIFECSITAGHPEQGTMTCRIRGTNLLLEAPLTRIAPAHKVSLGIRAGDVLVANEPPVGLSARNIIPGRIAAVLQQGVAVILTVECGAKFEVHVTPAAVHSLDLKLNNSIWLVIKTYSCHVLQTPGGNN